jgi:metal-dependent amidase/aminoacylase/carboxypeptidase family protein
MPIRYIRALNVTDVKVLRAKVQGCFEGAAISTGCELEIEWLADTGVPFRSYGSLWPPMPLATRSNNHHRIVWWHTQP